MCHQYALIMLIKGFYCTLNDPQSHNKGNAENAVTESQLKATGWARWGATVISHGSHCKHGVHGVHGTPWTAQPAVTRPSLVLDLRRRRSRPSLGLLLPPHPEGRYTLQSDATAPAGARGSGPIYAHCSCKRRGGREVTLWGGAITGRPKGTRR